MGDDSPSETTNLPAPPDDPGPFILYQLDHEATVAEFAAVQSERPRRIECRIERYNLDKEELEALNLIVLNTRSGALSRRHCPTRSGSISIKQSERSSVWNRPRPPRRPSRAGRGERTQGRRMAVTNDREGQWL